MSERVEISGLQISKSIYNLVTKDIIPGTNLSESDFWHSFAKIIKKFSPINEALLVERENMQQEIDNWHKKNIKNDFSFSDYKKFLQKINYLVPVGSDFTINTSNVDHEITSQAGPQLVVPVMNARFALNAANARWGSLYDSLYGTDVIPNDGKIKKTKQYNPARGEKVISYGKSFLDNSAPLVKGSHASVVRYFIQDETLKMQLENNSITKLLT